ncbi:unnamed protein product [Adineta ricciae]|uniref:Uncharacterized protein n=1 Tax=Adineta ricciae TaxID=249248 RepID=A0A814HW93_ADIRI|nr:unnamed protein product [Adineta ricciae]CAF1027267.1 unnamed protein product [Adineta ricciae]
MMDELVIADHIRDKLQNEIEHTRSAAGSFAMASIRWVQRYSHCYSVWCSFICLPLWILIVPVAFALDIAIYSIILCLFVFIFIIALFIAPCRIAYKYSSCTDAWNPMNIYRYSLTDTLACIQMVYIFFALIWLCYCGTGTIEDGAPMCCIYICCKSCHHACCRATRIQVNEQPCTIL